MLTIQGVYIGSRVVPYGSEGKSRTELGIQTQHVDGFGQPIATNSIIRVPASRLADVGKWESLKGQIVSVPVYVQAFPSRAGAGYSYWLESDGSPLAVKG